MNRREIPVNVWKKNILAKTAVIGNDISLPVVPDINIGDTDFRILPDAVFESCTRFVVDFYSPPVNRDAFDMFYKLRLDEYAAAGANSGIHDAIAVRQRIKESSGLSFEQENNFRTEIERNTRKLSERRERVSRRHEIIKARISIDPEFEKKFKDCESAYNELLVLAMQSDNDNKPLELLDAIRFVHELIGINIYEQNLPPIMLY